MLSEIKRSAAVLSEEEKLKILTSFLNNDRIKELGLKDPLTKDEQGEILQQSFGVIALLPEEVGVIKYPSNNEFAIAVSDTEKMEVWDIDQVRDYVKFLETSVAFGSVNKHLKQS